MPRRFQFSLLWGLVAFTLISIFIGYCGLRYKRIAERDQFFLLNGRQSEIARRALVMPLVSHLARLAGLVLERTKSLFQRGLMTQNSMNR